MYYPSRFLLRLRVGSRIRLAKKDGMDWEREQNRDIERDQEAEGMPTGGRRARQALAEGKRVRERKKKNINY